MADDWDQFPVYESPSQPEEDWSRFKPVEQQREAPEQRAAPAEDWSRFKPVEQPEQAPSWVQGPEQEPAPEPESQVGAGVRSFIHAIPGTLGGIAGGALAGGAAGMLGAGPVGSVVGAIGGALAGGFAGEKVKETGLNLIGFDDSHQLAVNAAEHPWTTAGAAAGAMALGGGASGASKAARYLGGGIGGALETGRELATGEDLSASKIGANVAGGALFARPYEYVNKLSAKGGQLAERWRPPSSDSTPGPVAASGVSEDMVPPAKATVEPDIGNPQSRPVGSETRYMKKAETETGDNAGMTVRAANDPIDVTTRAALEAEIPQTDPNAPTQFGPKLDAEYPRAANVQEAPPTAPQAEAPRPGAAAQPPIDAAAVPEPAGRAGRPPPEIAEPAARPMEQAAPAGEEGIPGFLKRGPDNRVSDIEPPAPLTPREAIAQRAPGETVGDILQRDVTQRGISGRPTETARLPISDKSQQAILEAGAAKATGPKLEPRESEMLAARRLPPAPGEGPIAKAGDAAEAARFEMDRALANKIVNRPRVRLDEAKTRGVAPEELLTRARDVLKEPITEASAAKPVAAPVEAEIPSAARGEESKVTPLGAMPPPAAEARPAVGGGGKKPPTNVGEAVTAGGGKGGGPPPPPNPGHIPPKQRGHWEELWRDVKRKVAPQTLGPDAREAQHQIRSSYGETERVAQQTKDLINKHAETIKPMSAEDVRALVNHSQGGDRFPDFKPTEAHNAYMKDRTRAMQEWEAQLHTLSEADQMQFRKDFMSQMYKNPQVAPDRIFSGTGKRGSAGSTKARKYDTYEDARDAGLEPFTENPIENDTRYINSIQNFVASRRLLQRGQESEHAGFFQAPKVKGASGSPEPLVEGGPPPDWIKLDGVPERNGRTAYGSPDWADVYNNFYGKGFKTDPKRSSIYETVRNATNAWTQVELGLNAYHPFTMANEAVITDLTKGFNNILTGQFAKGFKQIGMSPLAPVTMAKEGKIFQQEYLNPDSTNPIAAILAEANARPVGRTHAADYTMQERGSFINQWKPEKLAEQLQQAGREVSEDFNKAMQGTATDKVMFPLKQAGRVLQTTAAPIFDKYIPLLKAGAVSSQMKDWHEAMIRKNPEFDMLGNPEHRRAAVDAARKIVDSVDNRFGEAIHDNAFMNKTLQQSAVVGMRSYSWATGAIKEIGGGTYSAGRALGKLALSKGAENRFDMTHKDWDPRMVYPLALTVAVGAISTIYQFLRTGEGPSGWRDLYAPKTGGTVPGVGGRGQVPEHVLMPGYQKDVLGWLSHPGQEAYNKMGGLPTTIIEQATGKDWRGQSIVKPNATPVEAFGQRMAHFFGKLSPISAKNMMKDTEPTSNISRLETGLGFRAPGAYIQDPEGLKRFLDNKAQREYKQQQKRERKTQLRQNPQYAQ